MDKVEIGFYKRFELSGRMAMLSEMSFASY